MYFGAAYLVWLVECEVRWVCSIQDLFIMEINFFPKLDVAYHDPKQKQKTWYRWPVYV